MGYIGNQITTVFPSSVTVDKINDVTYVPNPPSGQITGRRNLIINGAMNVAQRATSATGLGGDGFTYNTVDRFKNVMAGSSAGRYTQTQTAVTALPGFANCLKFDCTTSDTSIAADEILQFGQYFEGQDVQQLKKGTSDAEKVTASFYVKGNASATYTCELEDADNTRYNAQTFSVTTSWNRVVLTFNADTTGTLDDDIANSLRLNIFLHAGSTYTGGTFSSNTWQTTNNQRASSSQTSFYDSTDREFFITGVQLELGSTATSFEHRSFGEEKQLCYRYYYQRKAATNFMKIGHGRAYDTSNSTATYSVPVPMRANPTGSISAASDVGVAGLSAGGTTSVSVASETYDDFSYFAINVTRSGGGFSTGTIYQVEADNNTNMKLMLDAEL